MEQFTLEQMYLAQIGLGRVLRDPRTMLDRDAGMGIAFDP